MNSTVFPPSAATVISPNVTGSTNATTPAGNWTGTQSEVPRTSVQPSNEDISDIFSKNEAQLAVFAAIIMAASVAAILFVALVSRRLRSYSNNAKNRKKMKQAGQLQMTSPATEQHRGHNHNESDTENGQKGVTLGP